MSALDEEQFPAGIGAPAKRALRGAGYTKLSDLANVSEAQLASLHGVGPKAVRTLKEALHAVSLRLSE